MVTLLLGENSFEIERQITQLKSDFDGEIVSVDSDKLTYDKLIDLVSGGDLFSTKKLVIIRHLSDNKPIWSKLESWIDRISDETSLVLIEPQIDKRTAIYKTLQKKADVKSFDGWSDRDSSKAKAWLKSESDKLGLKLDNKSQQFLLDWIGLDQWSLYHALEKLALVNGEIDQAVIENIVEPNLSENVFNLFEKALFENSASVKSAIQALSMSEDPYKVSGLIMSQGFQLLAVALAKSGDNPTKDFNIHPFVYGKLKKTASKLGLAKTKSVLKSLVKLDDLLKSSPLDPWLLLEQTLMKINVS